MGFPVYKWRQAGSWLVYSLQVLSLDGLDHVTVFISYVPGWTSGSTECITEVYQYLTFPFL